MSDLKSLFNRAAKAYADNKEEKFHTYLELIEDEIEDIEDEPSRSLRPIEKDIKNPLKRMLKAHKEGNKNKLEVYMETIEDKIQELKDETPAPIQESNPIPDDPPPQSAKVGVDGRKIMAPADLTMEELEELKRRILIREQPGSNPICFEKVEVAPGPPKVGVKDNLGGGEGDAGGYTKSTQ